VNDLTIAEFQRVCNSARFKKVLREELRGLWDQIFTEEDFMPAGYLKMKKEFMSKGMSKKAAEKKAARIWNAKHKSNPVGRGK